MSVLLIMIAFVVFGASEALALDGVASGATDKFPLGLIGLGSVIGLGLAAGGCGIGMGQTVNGAVGAMSRNPGAYGKIFLNMMIGLALIEGFVIYTLVIVFLFMYAPPWRILG